MLCCETPHRYGFRSSPRGWQMQIQNDFQGVTNAQSEIIAYWRSQQSGTDYPLRSEIDPGELRAHLASISIVEILSDGRMTFRIIGSKAQTLIKQIGSESSAHNIDLTPPASWCAGLLSCIDQCGPVGGLLESGAEIQTWLRLPLRSRKRGHYQILCHDAIADRSPRQQTEANQSAFFSSGKASLAA